MRNHVQRCTVELSGYFMRGGVEAVYDDMAKDLGVLRFAPVQPARRPMFSARSRGIRLRRLP